MSEAFSLTVLESLLGIYLPQEQRRTVIAQFLKGRPASVAVTTSPAGPQTAKEHDAYDSAIERAFVAAFGAPRRPVSPRRGPPASGRALPLRFRNAHSPSLRIAIEILTHRALADRPGRV